MAEPAVPETKHENALPDIMNDPEFATNNTDKDESIGDVDTCRICRGEGSEAEPLFYPCKCSGSIKHVHQDCLMEWLSHSQKKHCELCKTPFRFTKLYSPSMPQSVPNSVLFRHFLIHSARNFATWVRFGLVSIVWLACLPYAVRIIWRFLFWLSDGTWPSIYLVNGGGNLTSQTMDLAQQLIIVENGTSPVTPLAAAQTTPASMGGLVDKIIRMMNPLSTTLNISDSDPLISGLLKSLYVVMGASTSLPDEPLTNASDPRLRAVMEMQTAAQSPSLLSNYRFLNNLTSKPAVNQTIIAIAEGYIITLLVVVCFILVFLIREWVVQQQPGINMGAGFNAEFEVDRPRDQAAPENQDPPQRIAIVPVEARGVGNRPIARARRRPAEHEPEQAIAVAQQFRDVERLQELHLPFELHAGQERLGEQEHQVAEAVGPNHPQDREQEDQQRPVPIRNALTPATEIQRQVVEEPRMTEEFLAIWRRANGVPEEVLHIIEVENKVVEMRYWVNAMKVIIDPAGRNGTQIEDPEPRAAESSDLILGANHSTTSSVVVELPDNEGNGASESWIDVAKPLSYRTENAAPDQSSEPSEALNSNFDKGKGKAREDSKEAASDPSTQLLPGMNLNRWAQAPRDQGTSGRPRATSDGTYPFDGSSLYMRGSWNFSNLDKNAKSRSPSPTRSNDENAALVDSTNLSVPFVQTTGSPAWKAAQEVRVQQAVSTARARKFHPVQTNTPLEDGRGSFDASSPPGYVDGPMEVVGQNGVTRTFQNFDELSASDPDGRDFDDKDNGDDEDNQNNENNNPEPSPFAPDAPLPPVQDLIVQPPPVGLLGRVADYLWDDNDIDRAEQGANDEQVVQDIEAEAPFVPVAHDNGFDGAGEDPDQDHDMVQAAIAAGLDPNDPDAIDDAEDFEGIMELIGMRGPIFSLVQNAIFCVILLALTVAFGIWIPYNIGRITVVLIANPGTTFKLPLRLVFWCAAFLQDLFVSLMGVVSYCAISVGLLPVKALSSSDIGASWATAALQLSRDALNRVLSSTVDTAINFSGTEMFAFSATTHEAFLNLKWLGIDTLDQIGQNVRYLFLGDYNVTLAGIHESATALLDITFEFLANIPAFLAKPDSWVISLEVAKRSTPLDLELSIWSSADRFWAIVTGYTTLSVLGALYVMRGTPFSTGQVGQEYEAAIIDLLHQAGGVMKVILIISIEMLVFPLYCGLLLDAALLPLFDEATIMSRLLFTVKSPCTSMFVHWFVGTCYMFHFALFVSMCRKIMRKGVLYFIRDPDDPTFHPVRDVLERNVATQLRKILFSALVYGALVVVCLGGVVWGLSFAFKRVLPIHWSSNEPVLEFPIDLLFYNFLMPLAVRFFKPSDGLHAMYSWWFRQCARMLRLTWFMFDERRLDEEGYSVRRDWGELFRGGKGDPLNMVKTDDPSQHFIDNPEVAAYFRQDGRYVRAPASDQVRLPKETCIFLQVDELNNRLDGKWDAPDGVHGRDSELYKQVYIPPHFRLRICAFIVSIWIFAALTGVSITIVPLVFGRQVFASLIPSHVRKNDVYAFSIGIYILGSALYAVLHLKSFVAYLLTYPSPTAKTPRNVLKRVTKGIVRIACFVWTYAAFILLLPTLFAFVIEFYFILPLHTFFAPNESHTIHFVQSWTLGLLYVKLSTRLILFYSESRPASALRAITRNGYLNPDARLATRSFILPASLTLGAAVIWPWLLARVALSTVWKDSSEDYMVRVYRYVYPAVLATILLALFLNWLVSCIKGWKMRIRDEAYLIGERLHNFGERKAGGVGAGAVSVVPRRVDA